MLLSVAALANRGKMQCAPSAERNKEPIAEVLAKYPPFSDSSTPATCLEIASGTGQHAAHLAARYPHVVWQPTEYVGGSAGPEVSLASNLPNLVHDPLLIFGAS